MADDLELTDEDLNFEEELDEDDDICSECHEEFCECPDPHLVQHHLEKGLRIYCAYDYCDDPKIRELLEQAMPLVSEAYALNEQKIKELED